MSGRMGNGRRVSILWWLAYTAVFLPLGWFVFRPFYENGRSMVWDKDGLYQTFTTMVYYSEYWRERLSELSAGRGLSLPMVDFSVGLGFDVITTLNHYGFGDWMLLFSIPFKPEQMEICYGFLAVFRYYLSGLAFLCYCGYMKKELLPSLSGAVAYCFCGFALYAGVRHPYFLNSMVYFPLMLVGVESILKGRSGLLLSVTVGLAAGSNFYFMYMLTILTFLYALLRFFAVCGKEWRRGIGRAFSRGIGYYFLGLGLAAVFLLPSVLAYLGNARGGITAKFGNSPLFYEGWFYGELLSGFVFPDFSADYWVVLSYPFLAVFALVFFFTDREKKNGWAKLFFLILTGILLLPVGGLMMNGFGYVSHRWIYGYGFLIAWFMVCALERCAKISKGQLLICLAVTPVVFAAAWLAKGGRTDGFPAGCILALFYLLLLVVSYFGRERSRSLVLMGALLAGCGTALLNSSILYSPVHGDYVSQFHPKGQALNELSDCKEAQLFFGGGDFFRVDGGGRDLVNQSMVLKYNGISGFFSIVSDNVYQYMRQLEVDNVKFPNWFYGFGDRVSLNTLGSVKYYADNEGSGSGVPYGYRQVVDGVYENAYALPIGYAYTSVLGEEAFAKLSAVRKQQAMMQAVVLAGEEETSGPPPRYGEEELPYTFGEVDNVNWDPSTGALFVGQGGGSLRLEFEGNGDSETYLRFRNYDINGSGYELLHVRVTGRDDLTKKFYEASTESVWYGDFHNFIVNLGYSEEGLNEATVTFPFEGQFVLEGLELYSLPMEAYRSQAKDLRNHSMTGVSVERNRISGEIEMESDGLLCLSVPYSRGWSAKVDGRQVKVEKANLMYMAVPVGEGNHEVTFHYVTPGLKAGCILWLVSVGVTGYLIYSQIRTKNVYKIKPEQNRKINKKIT